MTAPRTWKSRRGTAMMVVLACLAVTSAVLGVIVKTAHAERRLVTRRQFEEQARLLAEAGVARANYMSNQDASYVGETWQLSAEQLGGKHAGSVAIVVSRAAGERTTVVIADYPPQEPQRARHSMTRKIEVPSP